MSARIEIPQRVIDKFNELPVPSIADALVSLDLRCVVAGIHPLTRDMRVCGPAVTIRQISARDRSYGLRHGQVMAEHSAAGDVLVIDAGGRTDVASWGINIAGEAKHRGLSGVVLDGAARDTQEIVEIGFSTFVRGPNVRTTHETFFSTCLNNEPVQIGKFPFAVMVAPGDLVIGDADGLVVVPAERSEEILDRSQRRYDLDLSLKHLLKAGKRWDDPAVAEQISKIHSFEGTPGWYLTPEGARNK
jgi:4-hydroxy-4-methyl-2-oxoglutarate aldolase